jgi:hypothetical protein
MYTVLALFVQFFEIYVEAVLRTHWACGNGLGRTWWGWGCGAGAASSELAGGGAGGGE